MIRRWKAAQAAKKSAKEAAEAPVTGVVWSMGSRLATMAVTGLLWAAVACGPVALGFVMGRQSPVAVAAASASGEDRAVARERQTAEEFAVRVVTVWLSAHRGQEDLLAALLPFGRVVPLPATGLGVADAMVAASVPSGEAGVWTVTVAAQVSDARMSARRFFALPVRVVGDSVVAVALPSERPGPQVIAAPPAVDYPVEVDARGPLQALAGDFLAAVLTGKGDVQRLVSPQAELRAVAPAPFAAVKVTQVSAQREVPEAPSDGARLELLVTAVAQVDANRNVAVQYPLTVTVRAGRWEVLAVRDVPLLSKKAANTVPSASPAPAESRTPTPSRSASPTP